jgi:sec-independent protein translocase protein TatC
VLLVLAGVVDVQTLSKSRPYVVVGCFAIGMVLTPPDVISQTLLAVPMWLLYEVGILFSRFVRPINRDVPESEQDKPAA